MFCKKVYVELILTILNLFSFKIFLKRFHFDQVGHFKFFLNTYIYLKYDLIL